MATAISKYLNIPYKEIFIKNENYRTFIINSSDKQKKSITKKLSPITKTFQNNSVLIVDDSIVRGTTVVELIRELKKKASVREIHIAIASPPILHSCHYGINIKEKEDFFARQFTEDIYNIDIEEIEQKMAKYLGVSTVSYLSIDTLKEVLGKNKCMACLNGEYPLMFSQDLIKKSTSKNNVLALN